MPGLKPVFLLRFKKPKISFFASRSNPFLTTYSKEIIMIGKRHNIMLFLVSLPYLLLTPCQLPAQEWQIQRQRMVIAHLKARDIYDQRVLQAMATVERHLFVPETVREYAYADRPLPIGEGQTISQPYIVALMSQLAEVVTGMKILEIGTGSGYQAAILNAIGAEVYSVEIVETLAQQSDKRIKEMNLPIAVKHADGYFGWPEQAPFDRILITAAANHIPPPLIKQLKPGGKLILPLGNIRYYQTLTILTKNPDGTIVTTHHATVRFVPMTGTMLQ
jgi:protein-L-isoaspartate(D-aspartate) O-methyltransferase